MVIDFHIHMFPDKLAEGAVGTLARRSGLKPEGNGTCADTLHKMAAGGADMAVVQNIATNAKQTAHVNDFAIELMQEPKLIPFGSVHPDCDWRYELDRLADNGIKGIKLHPDYQDFYIDEARMQPIYEYILKKGFILLFHAGLDIGLPNPVHAEPERTANVLGLFAGEKVVLAHMGGFQRWDAVEQYLLGKNIYLDTSCAASYMKPGQLEKMIQAHGTGKVLFATDFPWGNFGSDIRAIQSLPLKLEEKDAILYKNALKLLEMKDSEAS